MHRLVDVQSKVATHISEYLQAQHRTAESSYGPAVAQAIADITEVCQMAAPTHESGCLTYIGYILSGGNDITVALEAALAIELAVASRWLSAEQNWIAAGSADHMAEIIMANIPDTRADDRIKAISIFHRSSLLVLHRRATPQYFEYVNAIHTGMVLAGGDCHDTDDITPFAKALADHDSVSAREIAMKLQDRWPEASILLEVSKQSYSEH